MDKILIKMTHVERAIDRSLEAAKQLGGEPSIETLKNRLTKLEEAYIEFVDLSKKHYMYVNTEGFADQSQAEVRVEKKYFQAHELLSKAIDVQTKGSSSEVLNGSDTLTQLASQQAEFLKAFSSTTIQAELPFEKMRIPTFSGIYQEWPSFHDLYMGAIGNKQGLSNTQKFHYLKSYLSGEALGLIKHLPITEDNYPEAWSRLEQRYDRKPLIVRSFVQSFFSLPTMTSANVVTLRKIADGADEVIRGLKALKTEQRDPWLIQILLKKVDNDTKQAWAEKTDVKAEPNFDAFLTFLSRRCDALESCQPQRSSSNRNAAVTSLANVEEQQEKEDSKKQNSKTCVYCNEPHALASCAKFKVLNFEEKSAIVKSKSLCFNCLNSSHYVDKCPSHFRCRLCKGKHHSVLHNASSTSTSTNKNTKTTSSTPSKEVSESNNSTKSELPINNHLTAISLCVGTQTLLPTMQVLVKDIFGKFVSCRILLDTGSTVSLVSEAFIQRIGVSRSHAKVSIAGLACTNAGVSRGQVTLELISRSSTSRQAVDLLIMPKITTSLPAQSVDCSSSTWTQIVNLDLADPTFGVPGPIDALIGCDQLWSVHTGEVKQFGPNLPVAFGTIFGWVIAGPCGTPRAHNFIEVTNHALEDIESMIRSLLEMDNIQTSAVKVDNLDPTEVHFKRTHTRLKNGTYVVDYPFKDHSPPFDSTLPQAMKRLAHIERRFGHDETLKRQYTDFIEEYLQLGHMEVIPENEVNINKEMCCYLPHHAVLKPSSSTTKCRVVFDGSCKDASGVSLNDRLHIGPPIQRDVFGVSLRFRQHRYVFCADIEKMFRGIRVAAAHTNFQRIVWRKEENTPCKHYRLLTVTYGLASSPFIAVRVLKQLADDYQSRYPHAALVLSRDAYVDDIATGCDSVDGLIGLQQELVALMNEANFNLRKWSSNCWALLETIPKQHCELDAIGLSSKDSSVKILGLCWNPCRDELFLKVESPNITQKPTKRAILSELSKVYDPLGIVAPTVVLFKVLFQETWSTVKSWDDTLPDRLAERWMSYMTELPLLSKIRIPRYISTPFGSIELHAFADASSVACAAVIYTRIQVDGLFVTKLLASKTRVAPIKPLSIPRLELNAAVLLSRLVTLVKASLSIPISDVFCWSDSQIVLHWLSSPPRKWNVFVCNRTAEILEVCPRNCWQHVKSEDNPADCASRGLLPSKLLEDQLWWSGPAWLSLSRCQWPPSALEKGVENYQDVLKETKKNSQRTLWSQKADDVIENLINKYSSWNRLVRVVAYCCRFLKIRSGNFIHPLGHQVLFETLTTSELKQSRNLIFRHMQMSTFSRDLVSLKEKGVLSHKSRLSRYTPFVDEHRILRVGGRLTNATIHYNAKHPILLPRDSKAVMLIIRDVHNNNLHSGVDSTFFLLRQQFWILGCRNLVRKVVFGCKICFMQRRATSSQLMGQLPTARVTPTRSFLHCGLDYAGPVPIKLFKGRSPKQGKAWFAIFVCLSTKAFHIELVSELTTNAFLAAYRRFCSRRGKPSDIYSDNGTNFRGAKRALDELQQLAISRAHNTEIAQTLAQDGINWHFIPPSAPHFGGLWESGVRSVKLHLRRVIGSNVLTYEEYATVLTQIEAVLNSRPVCANSDDQLDAITPAHFLNGETYTCVPEPSLLDEKPNLLHRWRALQAKVQGFWKRWQEEYITSLQQRPKWQKAQPNIQVGQLVVLKEPNLPPSKWLLGKVDSVAVGADNLVRVVTVKTSRGLYKRPINKVAVLPMC